MRGPYAMNASDSAANYLLSSLGGLDLGSGLLDGSLCGSLGGLLSSLLGELSGTLSLLGSLSLSGGLASSLGLSSLGGLGGLGGVLFKEMVAPVSAAIFSHSATSSGSGWYFLGAQAVKCRPILAQPTIRLLPML